jgi:superfamily II DNA or RNA helicase
VTAAQHTPGSLVRARGREWIVLSGSDADVLRVRPMSGSEDDQTLIHLGLETEPVTEATFPAPDPRQRAGHDAALLLRDALLLSLRRGAGPLRCFGQIAVEPRAYQLVPLLMALKLDPIRILIGDDVGIGKTIEAGLIAREMIDRGEVDRIAVLVPPHLVDQWLAELEARFHIRAVAVTATSASRLERDLPPSESIFSAHPFTVVSLDYIKSEKRRAEFLRACPDFVIVDEAHTCASTGPGRHQRYELLKALAESERRHLVMLTATPHSGDEAAFYRLLGLLHPDFLLLADAEEGLMRSGLRSRLAAHFVQRRRPDIAEWKEHNLFPKRETKELTYKLTGAWQQFFESVLDYCADLVQAAGRVRGASPGKDEVERRQRVSFWGTLALLRCAASSPVAAVSALRTRAGLETDEDEREALLDRVFDGTSESLPDDDVEPPAGTDDPKLAALIASAEQLAGQAGDPKLKVLTEHLKELIQDGHNPVVFCRYITTAHYLGRHLADKFKGVTVGVVTGELTSEERREKVDALCDPETVEQRLLIATDCLSEGINLQDGFDAVVHYDLSWNPTRHEQREGRVDRFGQKKPLVRATLMYGANNPVDGAVLEVILRKAEKIREELGVPVPVPAEGASLTEVLLKSVLLKRRGATPTSEMKQISLFDTEWKDAAEKVKRNTTVFAQRRLKPDDVLPEWNKTLAAVGGSDDVHRFTDRALARLGSGLEAQGRDGPHSEKRRRGFKAPLGPLPEDVRERLESEGLAGTLLVDFAYPPAPRCRAVQRSHPLVAVLAETLLERTLAAVTDDPEQDPGVLGRIGCWVSADVTERNLVLLLRLRHQLVTQKSGRTSTLLVEEATAVAWAGSSTTPLEGEAALALFTAAPPPGSDPPAHVRDRAVTYGLEQLAARRADLDALASRRAQALLADHRRVREASADRGSYSVKALLPTDVIGAFVLLPRVS